MKQAILTYVDPTGPVDYYKGLFSTCLPYLKKYAQRCKVDLIVPFSNTPSHPKYTHRAAVNLYRFDLIYKALEDYDRVLWVDADILIRRDSPNLFDLVPHNCFAAHENNEVYHVTSTQPQRDDYYWNLRIERVCNKNGWEKPDTRGCQIDSGVMLVNKSHQDIFAPIWGLVEETNDRFCEEMLLVNIRLFQDHYDLYYLPQCFNYVVKHGGKHPERSNFFLHYAGLPGHEKLLLAKQHATAWGPP